MKILIAVGSMLLTACSTGGGASIGVSEECSQQAFRALRQEIRRAELASKPLNAAANRDPTETNTAAAASAAADIAIAEANLAVAEEECRESR